jgi:hypothetical protein
LILTIVLSGCTTTATDIEEPQFWPLAKVQLPTTACLTYESTGPLADALDWRDCESLLLESALVSKVVTNNALLPEGGVRVSVTLETRQGRARGMAMHSQGTGGLIGTYGFGLLIPILFPLEFDGVRSKVNLSVGGSAVGSGLEALHYTSASIWALPLAPFMTKTAAVRRSSIKQLRLLLEQARNKGEL